MASTERQYQAEMLAIVEYVANDFLQLEAQLFNPELSD